jgi:hypothetical protein
LTDTKLISDLKKIEELPEGKNFLMYIFTYLRFTNEYVIEHIPGILNEIPNNQSASILVGSRGLARDAFHYMAGYMSKDPMQPSIIASVLNFAMRRLEKYPPAKTDKNNFTVEELGTKKFWNIMVNNTNSLGELSATQCSALLIGLNSTVSSCRFTYVYPYRALDQLSEVFNKHPNYVEIIVDENNPNDESDEDSSTSDSEPAEVNINGIEVFLSYHL